ncbi:hypothetical protein VNO77_33845 [Canavalia gladiata]|uniref:Uncharacterized protein n=1 Tax=Canavalia gladiata TaxID=3824 RepID=A0AAN9PWR1_CANGL
MDLAGHDVWPICIIRQLEGALLYLCFPRSPSSTTEHPNGPLHCAWIRLGCLHSAPGEVFFSPNWCPAPRILRGLGAYLDALEHWPSTEIDQLKQPIGEGDIVIIQPHKAWKTHQDGGDFYTESMNTRLQSRLRLTLIEVILPRYNGSEFQRSLEILLQILACEVEQILPQERTSNSLMLVQTIGSKILHPRASNLFFTTGKPKMALDDDGSRKFKENLPMLSSLVLSV